MELTERTQRRTLPDVADELIACIKKNWPSGDEYNDFTNELVTLRQLADFIQHIMDSAKNDTEAVWELAKMLSKSTLFREPKEFRCYEAFEILQRLPQEMAAVIICKIPNISEVQVAEMQNLLEAGDSHGFIQKMRTLPKYQSIFGVCSVMYRGQSLWEYVFDNGGELNEEVCSQHWLRGFLERANRFYTSDYYRYKHQYDGMMHNILLMLRYTLFEDFRDDFCAAVSEIGALINLHLASLYIRRDKGTPAVLCDAIEKYINCRDTVYAGVYEHLTEEYSRCDTVKQRKSFVDSLRISIDDFGFVMKYLGDYKPRPIVKPNLKDFVVVEKIAIEPRPEPRPRRGQPLPAITPAPLCGGRSSKHIFEMIPVSTLKEADVHVPVLATDDALSSSSNEGLDISGDNTKNKGGRPLGEWIEEEYINSKDYVINTIKKKIWPEIKSAAEEIKIPPKIKGRNATTLLAVAMLYNVLRSSGIAKNYDENGVKSSFHKTMYDMDIKYRLASLPEYMAIVNVLDSYRQELRVGKNRANSLLSYDADGKFTGSNYEKFDEENWNKQLKPYTQFDKTLLALISNENIVIVASITEKSIENLKICK